jgi:glutamate synthase (NADPH/NADH) small chain
MKEIAGSEFELPCELVLLALGFLGPEPDTMIAQLGCELTHRGNVKVGPDYQTTVPGAFSCGDMRRGQSLVVWANLGRPRVRARRRRLSDGRDGAAVEPGAVERRKPKPAG